MRNGLNKRDNNVIPFWFFKPLAPSFGRGLFYGMAGEQLIPYPFALTFRLRHFVPTLKANGRR
jgi:hypothetical protein